MLAIGCGAWLAALLVVVAGCSWWLPGLGTGLIKSTHLEPAEVMVVLSGGGVVRTDRAAELYLQGYSNTLLVSGGVIAVLEGTVAAGDLMHANLVRQGVPPSAILHERRSQSTWENALFSREVLEPAPRSMIVVTEDFHTRRAYYVFRKIFPDTQVMVAPAKSSFPIHRWWTEEQGLITVQNEWFRLLWYLLRYRVVPLG